MSTTMTHRPPHQGSSPSNGSSSTKTSLGYIMSPATNPTAPFTRDPTPRSTLPPARPKRHRSRLESLPRSLLAHIALQLVVDRPNRHPSALIPFALTSRTIYDSISFDNNPQLYNNLFRVTFDTSALDRRYEWMVKHLSSMAGRGRKVFDLFSDPRSWAIDYKTRWEQSYRMREVARHASFEIPGVCTREMLVADLWNVWFLLTENDGRNIHFLAQECSFQRWIVVYYREDLLKDSLNPGYPKETGEKSLATWCALMSGADLSAEQTPTEVDEKIFVMRPFVFACAKYEITYAPWHHRKLPLCPPNCNDHEPDVTLRSKAMPYKRFGYTWRRAPPHFILGMYLSFMRLLERQPGRMGLKPGSSTFATPPGSPHCPGLFSITRILPSIYHDREWQRNSVCQDPHTSPGLPPTTFRGELEGFWRMKFLFYDFDMYRQILAGNMRGVYTGTFSEQAGEVTLVETIIRVRKEDVGGKGPTLDAGFDAMEDDETEAEQQRIQEGYGHEVWDGVDETDEEGWTKEILLSGKSRTSWGNSTVRGRVRAWDGLIVMSMTYSRAHAMGRWLYRGYLHTGGYLVGRWRDTFTPEHLRGYEGAFGMIRAGDVFYPPQYPMQMADSLGLDALTGAGHTYPPQSLLNRTYPAGHAPAGPAQPAPAQPAPAQQAAAQQSTAQAASAQPAPVQAGPSQQSQTATGPSNAPDADRTNGDDNVSSDRNAGAPGPSRPAWAPERLDLNGAAGSTGSARRESLSRVKESSLRDERE